MKKNIAILIIFFTFGASTITAQNVGSLWKDTKNKFKHPVKISGNLSANQVYYNAWGGDLRLQPYSYFLMGRVNLSILSVKLPFSFKYSNQKYNFKKPQFQTFNNFGITPYYKWVKLYLGYNSMRFSNYVMVSPFTGAGIELTPGHFTIAAMYGRFSKAILPDSTNNSQPVYKRKGYALKIKYGSKADYIGISMFKASDDTTSLEYIYAIGNKVQPQENFVYNIEVSKKFLSNFLFNAEFANTFITNNITNQALDDFKPTIRTFGFNFIDPKISSGSYYAYKSKLVYTFNKQNIGVNFEHIDDGYKTLGAPYFNSDIERISLLFASVLMDEKIKIDFNIGKERNNLKNENISSSKKLNYSINFNFIPVQRINVSMNYSNFTSFARMESNFKDINQTYFENLDTLNYSQVAQNANLNGFFMLSDPQNKDKQQNLMINVNYQQAADIRNDTTSGITENSNLNLAYMHSLLPIGLTFTSSVNANYAKITGYNNITYGPTVSVGKSFFKKKWTNTVSFSWNQTNSDKVIVNNFTSGRLISSFKLKKHHTFRLSLVLVNRKNSTKNFSELTGNFNYSFKF